MGCLKYSTSTMRPDLCASTNYFSRYQSCFKKNHFNHAKRILRYIKSTVDLNLIYHQQKNAEPLVGYTDSDWAVNSKFIFYRSRIYSFRLWNKWSKMASCIVVWAWCLMLITNCNSRRQPITYSNSWRTKRTQENEAHRCQVQFYQKSNRK